jgi:hypothetical protein
MALLRRLGAALVLVLAAAGLVGCAGAVVGVWLVWRDAPGRADEVLARVDAGLRRASAATENVRSAVRKARADVAEAAKKSADLGEGGQKGRAASRALKTVVRKKVGPGIEDLRGRLATCSDAAVAASSLLESLQELPLGQTGRIQPGKLELWEAETRQLSTKLRRLQAAVGEGGKQAGGQQVAAATDEVDAVLRRCQAKADAWQSGLDAAREQLRHVRAKVPDWLTLAAIAVTVLAAWMAAGQASLFAHALSWLRGRPGEVSDVPGS